MPKNLQKPNENQCFWAHGGSRDGSNMASWPLQPTAEASWSNLPATWRTRWQLAGNLAELGPNCGGFRSGLGDVWGGLGRVWGGLGESLGHLGAVLGPSWARLGAIVGHLGAILGDLKRS